MKICSPKTRPVKYAKEIKPFWKSATDFITSPRIWPFARRYSRDVILAKAWNRLLNRSDFNRSWEEWNRGK
jgi:hypothetical protein